MGGPNLEVFRFGVYVFVPIAFFYYFNLPEYYNKFVRPDLVRLGGCKGMERKLRRAPLRCAHAAGLQKTFHPTEGIHKVEA